MKRKILAALLSIVTICCMMPAVAFAVSYPVIEPVQVWTGKPISLISSKGDIQDYFTLKDKDGKVIGSSKDYWEIKATDVGDYVVVYVITSKGPQNAQVQIRKTPTVDFINNTSWTSGEKLFSGVELIDPLTTQTIDGDDIKVTATAPNGSNANDWVNWNEFKLNSSQVRADGTVDLYYYLTYTNLADNSIYFCGSSGDLSGIKHPSKITVTVNEQTPVPAENLTYNARDQKLLTSGNSEHYWINSEDNQIDDIEDVVATNAGTYKIYYGDTFNENKFVTATIAPFALTKDNVSIEDSVYTGKAQKPTKINCKIDEDTTVTLVEGQDYDNLVVLPVSTNEDTKGKTNPGHYKVTFDGIGNFTSTYTGTYDWYIREAAETKTTGTDTGDSNDIALFGILGLLALCGAGFVYKKREN